MKAKEFKEKFKEGNVISTSEPKAKPLTITAIGEKGFMAKCEEGIEYTTCFTFKRDWQHYKEPVEKDLEGVEKLVLVYKGKKGIRIDVINCDKTYSDFLRSILSKDQEIITIEEAIERGLKL